MNSLGGRAVLYICLMAPSASGKNRPREVIQQIYAEAGCPEYFFPEDMTSDTAYADFLQAQPAGLAMIDEFGKILAVANHPNASGPHKLAAATQMKLYTSAGVSEWRPKKMANKKDDRVAYKPHLTILGTTTPDAMQYLTADSFKDGYNSRFVFYNEASGRPPHRKAEQLLVPESLIRFAKEWSAYRTESGDSLWELHAPDQRVIQLTEESVSAWDRFRLLCDILANSMTEDEGGSIWARAAERAHNVALIRAASENLPDDDFQIEKSHMDWAIAIVDWLTTQSIQTLQKAGQNERERDAERIVAFVHSRRSAGASMTEIIKKFRAMPKRYRDELIAELINTGELMGRETSTGGRPKQTFWTPTFFPSEAFCPSQQPEAAAA